MSHFFNPKHRLSRDKPASDLLMMSIHHHHPNHPESMAFDLDHHLVTFNFPSSSSSSSSSSPSSSSFSSDLDDNLSYLNSLINQPLDQTSIHHQISCANYTTHSMSIKKLHSSLQNLDFFSPSQSQQSLPHFPFTIPIPTTTIQIPPHSSDSIPITPTSTSSPSSSSSSPNSNSNSNSIPSFKSLPLTHSPALQNSNPLLPIAADSEPFSQSIAISPPQNLQLTPPPHHHYKSHRSPAATEASSLSPPPLYSTPTTTSSTSPASATLSNLALPHHLHHHHHLSSDPLENTLISTSLLPNPPLPSHHFHHRLHDAPSSTLAYPISPHSPSLLFHHPQHDHLLNMGPYTHHHQLLITSHSKKQNLIPLTTGLPLLPHSLTTINNRNVPIPIPISTSVHIPRRNSGDSDTSTTSTATSNTSLQYPSTSTSISTSSSSELSSLLKKEKKFPCPICHKRFARAFNLQTHIATHDGIRPFECPALDCGKAFSRRHDLSRHLHSIHHRWLSSKGLTAAQVVAPLKPRRMIHHHHGYMTSGHHHHDYTSLSSNDIHLFDSPPPPPPCSSSSSSISSTLTGDYSNSSSLSPS